MRAELRSLASRMIPAWMLPAWMLPSGALLLASVGCTFQPEAPARTAVPTGLAAQVEKVLIEPAPEHLQGRVALPAGARLYSRPSFTSPSWSLTLPSPPLQGGDDLPRVRAFRAVGVVRSGQGPLGSPGDFIAVTNDLDGESEDGVLGCGPRLDDIEHLRMLLYVPVVHLAQVTTRTLEVEPLVHSASAERLQLGAGVRVGPAHGTMGPAELEGASWRSIDADGIRSIAAIPDDAIGLAWDPERVPDWDDAGDALFRDAEGSTMWLRDDGGATVVLSLRNACAEHRREVADPKEVEQLRALALDVFYDQHPATPPEPVTEDQADYRIPVGTPLRWPDGDLAGEVLADWSVAIGVGQTWDGRRCFSLPLGSELRSVDAPALACVDPDALVLLEPSEGFAVSDELALGGSIELGPVRVLSGDAWDDQALRAILNGRHASVSECLRPMLVEQAHVVGARWDLRLTVTEVGHVDEVEVEARGFSLDQVEDCLRAEVFTWLLPRDGVGQLEIPVTLGDWSPDLDDSPASDVAPDSDGGPDPREPASREPSGRGQVIIIPDEGRELEAEPEYDEEAPEQAREQDEPDE